MSDYNQLFLYRVEGECLRPDDDDLSEFSIEIECASYTHAVDKTCRLLEEDEGCEDVAVLNATRLR